MRYRGARVVITGLGACYPLGVGVRHVWKRLLKGESGIVSLGTLPNAEEFKGIPSRVVGVVPKGCGEGLFNEGDWIEKWERKTLSLASTYGICATWEALNDAGLLATDSSSVRTTGSETPLKKYSTKDVSEDRIGVCFGVGMVDMADICEEGGKLKAQGPRRVSPHFLPRNLGNMSSAQLSIRFGLRGPSQSQSTACTTGLHSLGDAACLIARGAADVMVAGGSEAPIYPLGMAGFSQTKALSTKYNSNPVEASRPFDSGRDGFVMSEGSAVLVLEEMEHALCRGAPEIYGEVLGYGLSCDAYHLTAPNVDGLGAAACMREAMGDAGISSNMVGHINAHATSTPLGDRIESQAIKNLFKENALSLPITSTKGSTGHLLGAAGSLEAIFTVLAVHEGIIPPTINFTTKTSEFSLNIVSPKAVLLDSNNRMALTNSYGFGGTNASICISRFPSQPSKT